MTEQEHNADIDALVREAYRLGYEDRSKESDYDPGHALDLLYLPTEPDCKYYAGCAEPARPCGYCATHCLCDTRGE